MKKKNIIEEEERRTQDMSVVAEYNGEKSNRARLVEHEGDDYVDTPVKDDTFVGKTGNFWYHHKWHVILTAIVLVIAAVGIYQFATREKAPDYIVLYTGPAALSQGEVLDVEDSLAKIISGEDGTARVYMYYFRYLNADQRGSVPNLNYDENQKNYSSYSDLVFTGECGLMFLDGALYDDVKEAGGLDTLDDVLGYTPERAFDEYGIRLCDTEAYQMYESLRVFPENTIVCVRSISTAGGVMISEKEAQRNHERGVEAAKAFFSLGE